MWSLLVADLHLLVVAAAVELGLLDAIGDGADVGELAEAGGLAPRATRTVVEHLAALGLLDVDGQGRVSVSPWVDAHLRPAGGCFGDMLRACARENSRYDRLLAAVRLGACSPATVHYSGGVADASVRGSYLADAAVALADALDLGGRSHLLDVGGGHGVPLAALLERWPTLTATLLDLPPTAACARREFAARGLGPRARVLAGDFRDGLPEGLGPDVVLLSQILVDLDTDERLQLLGRCRQILQPGGELIVHEMLAVPGVDEAMFAAMNTEMLLWSRGRHLTREQLEEALAESGFEQVSTAATWGLWSAVRAVAP